MSQEQEKGGTSPGHGAGREQARQEEARQEQAQQEQVEQEAGQPEAAQGSPPQPGPEAAGEGVPEGPPPEPSAEERLAGELGGARRELEAAQDRHLRLQAEFENFKKRIAKEHADSLRFALTPLVAEVAAIMDNLERAVAHSRQEQGETLEQLLAGIELVIKQMQEALARFGVTRIEAVGKPFDPTLHEAMTVVETHDVPENQVIDEFQPGYLLHDRVVRPARVSVAKPPADAGGEGSNAEN